MARRGHHFIRGYICTYATSLPGYDGAKLVLELEAEAVPVYGSSLCRAALLPPPRRLQKLQWGDTWTHKHVLLSSLDTVPIGCKNLLKLHTELGQVVSITTRACTEYTQGETGGWWAVYGEPTGSLRDSFVPFFPVKDTKRMSSSVPNDLRASSKLFMGTISRFLELAGSLISNSQASAS